MRWVTCDSRLNVGVLVAILCLATLAGCGKPEPVQVEAITVKRQISREGPRVDLSIRPIRIGEAAELRGFTFRSLGPPAAGAVYDATLGYRSLRNQEGEFTVRIQLLSDGKPVTEERTAVRTRREPVQKYLLEKGEDFWARSQLQVPLGLNPKTVEILATLEVRDEESGKPVAIPPPLRLGP